MWNADRAKLIRIACVLWLVLIIVFELTYIFVRGPDTGKVLLVFVTVVLAVNSSLMFRESARKRRTGDAARGNAWRFWLAAVSVLCCFCAGLAILVTIVQLSISKWRDFCSPDEGFCVSVPAELVRSPTTSGTEVTSFAIQVMEKAFSVRAQPKGDITLTTGELEIFYGSIKGRYQRDFPDFQLKTEKRVSHYGNPGFEVRFEQKDSMRGRIAVRVLVTEKHFFQMRYINSKVKHGTRDRAMEKFFDSFRLVDDSG